VLWPDIREFSSRSVRSNKVAATGGKSRLGFVQHDRWNGKPQPQACHHALQTPIEHRPDESDGDDSGGSKPVPESQTARK
ncbi:MAG: hypothetical protein ACKVII_26750, partial [Planctomycetales bacterium]